ncbi:MAG: orotidine-5'-phosphate decarboxylase [Clostridiales bacterium]|nr:orotidine-5'-phosphate decarboxylase [Clostridiales bacterium]
MITDALIEQIIAKQNPTCVGLDTSFDYLPEDMKQGVTDLKGAADAILAFNKKIIDHVYDIVPSVKVQIAYYEQYGTAGLNAFKATCAYAKEKGLIVITDAKRNDIGATASRYATAFLGETNVSGETYEAFPSDILTVNGYLGSDGIVPFTDECKKHDKGIFVLVKTSNPSSGELQNLKLEDGRTVYECMGDMVEKWGEGTVGKYGYSAVGAVVGATYPEEAKVLRARLPHTFFLVPGYGAQGANAEMLKNCFDKNGLGGVVNNSRGILCAYQKRGGTYYEAARAACLDMKKDLLSVLGEICAK